jgi:hypothetical protein
MSMWKVPYDPTPTALEPKRTACPVVDVDHTPSTGGHITAR